MAATTDYGTTSEGQFESDGGVSFGESDTRVGTSNDTFETRAIGIDANTTTPDISTVTLITGHTVEIRQIDDGNTTLVTSEDEDIIHQVDTPQGTYVFPDDVDLDVYDRDLFNVDLLLEQNLSDSEAGTIPVIMEARELRSVSHTDEPTTASLTGFQQTGSLTSIGATAGTVDKATAAETFNQVFETHKVDRIHLDRTVEIDLDTSAAAAGAEQAREQYGVTGTGATVAVLDTGVDATHPDLGHAVINQKDFTGDGVGDVNGHGTHVAGTIAGSGNASNGLYVGIAPDADIVDVKVLNDDGEGRISDIVAGIEYAHNQNVDVISMSLGGSGGPDSPINQVLDDAIDDGIVAVVAAGNNGDQYETLDDPGINERAITVGAYDHSAKEMATFSSRGPTSERRNHGVDLVAPGVRITAAAAGTDGEFQTKSGTSMATPHVSGAVALLLEQNDSLDNDAIRQHLLSTTDPLDGYDTYTQGAGNLNVTRAMAPSLVINEPTHNFGVLGEDGNISTHISLENPTDEATTLTVDSVLTNLEGDHYTDQLHLNRSTIEVGPGETAPVELSINATVPSGDYGGALHIVDERGTEYRSVFAFARGSQVTIEKQPFSEEGTTTGDEVWLMTADAGPKIVTLQDGTAQTVVGNGEYTVWSAGFDTPTATPIHLSESATVDGATVIEIDEHETVAYTIDESDLDHNLRSVHIGVVKQTKLRSETTIAEYDWSTTYRNYDVDEVRFSDDHALNVSVHHVAVPSNQHYGENNVDVDDVYQFVHATKGVTGPETLVLDKEEFLTQDRNYTRTYEDQPLDVVFLGATEVWDQTSTTGTALELRDQSTQSVHLRTVDAPLIGGLIMDSGWALLPTYDGSTATNRTMAVELNRHPYTTTVSIDSDSAGSSINGIFQRDQPPERLQYLPDDTTSEFTYAVNGDVVDEGTANSFFTAQGPTLTPGDEVRLDLTGNNTADVLSTETDSVYEFAWEGTDSQPPIEIPWIGLQTNETSVITPNADGTITFPVTIRSTDTVDSINVLTAATDVDDPAFDGATTNPAETWETGTVTHVKTDGDYYTYEVTANISEYDDRPHLGISATDTANNRVQTTVRNAFHAGDTPNSEVTVNGTVTLATGEPATHDQVAISGRNLFTTEYTNSEGEFDAELPVNGRYSLGYYSTEEGSIAPVKDGSPDIIPIDRITVGDTDVDIGNYTLPEANILDVEVVDGTGSPVEGADVRIAAFNDDNTAGWGSGFSPSTNADGFLDFESFEGTGIEVVGDVTVQVKPPQDSDRFPDNTYEQELTVTDDEHLIVELKQTSVKTSVNITGTLLTANGEPAANDVLQFDGVSTTTTTDEDGTFSAKVNTNGTHSIGYYRYNDSQFAPVRDGSPDVHSFERVSVGTEDVELGNVTLPEADILNIVVVDEDGEPISDAPVNVMSYNDDRTSGYGTGTETTNDAGQLVYADADKPGIEVTGEVTVTVEPPEDTSRFVDQSSEVALNISDDETLTVELEEIDDSEPASFNVSIDRTNLPVMEGETLTVDATIENVGDENDTQSIELRTEQEIYDEITVGLTGGENESVTLEWPTDDGDAGEHSLWVTSNDDSANTTAEIDEAPEPAEFEVSNLEPADETVTRGDEFDVSANITNIGDETGDQTVELYIVDEVIRTKTLELTSGETEHVTFTNIPTADLDGGDYEYGISSENDTKKAIISVAEPAAFDVTIDSTNTPIMEGETLTVDVTVQNIGDEAGEQTLVLSDDEQDIHDERPVALGGDQSVSVTFEWSTARDDAGERTLTVASNDDQADVAVKINEAPDPAEFEVTDLEPTNATVTRGDEFNVTASITNSGNKTGEQTIALSIAGEEIRNKILELEANETGSVAFANVATAELQRGDYDYGVSSENDTKMATVAVVEPAAFDVTIDETNAPVMEGERLTVNTTIENVGDKDDTQKIELRTDQDVRDEITVELTGGETESVTLEWIPEEGDSGEHTLSVASEDDSVETDVTIEEALDPAEFNISIDGRNAPVTEGETLAVTATVANVGDKAGEQTLELHHNGDLIAEITVRLDGGADETVTLEWVTEEGDAGEHTLTVRSEDDNVETAVEITEQSLFAMSSLEAPDEAAAGDTINVSATVENLGGQDTQVLELRLGEEITTGDSYTVLENETVTLSSGANRTVSFETILPDTVEDEQTEIGIASEEAVANTTISIGAKNENGGGGMFMPPIPSDPKPAIFELGSIEVRESVTPGEQLTVELLVENVGEESDTAAVTLALNDEQTTKNIVIAGGEARTVTLDTTAPEATGEYDMIVETEDDTATATLIVETGDESTGESGENEESDSAETESDKTTADESTEESNENTESNGSTTELDDTPADDTVPGFGFVTALLAVAMVVYRLDYRSK